jgi:hypothetical protein
METGQRTILRKKLLRIYEHAATRVFDCWHCGSPISPGDIYMEEVFALRIRFEDGIVRDRVETWKSHASGCVPPEDEPWMHEDAEEPSAPASLPLAA